MNKKLIHRGPDRQETWNDDKVMLGHTRLSIIDLSDDGKQPMFDHTGTIGIVFNGEIYNYKELKYELMQKGYKFNNRTDTEVIMACYMEYGVECLAHLNGMFAFCIYDIPNRQLFLARDRMGEKPLYYWEKDDKFIFSSEIKALLECDEIKKEANMEAVNSYLTFRYNPNEETFFKGIKKLMPSHWMLYDLTTKNLKIHKYWQPLVYDNQDNITQNAKKLFQIYKDSIKDKLEADVQMGVFLSGGIDSASIVAMTKLYGLDLNTYSINFGEDERNKDHKYAKIVSDYFDTTHKEIVVTPDVISLLPKIVYHCDCPLADSSLIATYLLAKEVKKDVTVAFGGGGGDEIFAGYQHHKFAKYQYLSRLIPKKLPITAYKLFNKPIKKVIPHLASFGDDGIKRFSNLLNKDKTDQYLEMVSIFNEQEKEQLLGYKPMSLKPKFQPILENKSNSFLKNIQLLELNTFLTENVLQHTDKMSMASGIEYRSPLLDHNLVNFGLNIPDNQKIHGLNEKFVFKKAMVEHLPKEITDRKKQPFFTPMDTWINTSIKNDIKQICYDKNFLKLNTKYIDKMFTNINLYKSRQIFSIATLNSWHEVFFENQ